MRQPVDVIGRYGCRALVGWLAPATVTAEGAQPAKVYLSGNESTVTVGDHVRIGSRVYVATSVSYWHPGDLEVALSGEVLVDRCRIERLTGYSYDPVTNVATETWEPIWTGPCDVQASGDLAAREVDAAGVMTTLARLLVSVPASVADVRSGDTVVIEQSADARLVGQRLTVTGVRMSTTPSLRILLLEDAE